MRITKQSSGERGVKGRGEYELCDIAENVHLWPSDLVGYTISFRIGAVVFHTGVKVTKAQDKYRLRVEGSDKRNMQAVVQVASALLMPPVARGEDKMFGGDLVLLYKGYVIKNITFGSVVVDPSRANFLATIETVECSNRTIEIAQIPAAERMCQVQYLWQQRDRFPMPIAELLAQHEALVCAGQPIPASTRTLIRRLQHQAERLNPELGVTYARSTDVLPALLKSLAEHFHVPVPQFSLPAETPRAKAGVREAAYIQPVLLGDADSN